MLSAAQLPRFWLSQTRLVFRTLSLLENQPTAEFPTAIQKFLLNTRNMLESSHKQTSVPQSQSSNQFISVYIPEHIPVLSRAVAWP